MYSRDACETAYRPSGTIWNELLIPNESSKSIICEQNSRPAAASTSCVIIEQLRAPSGQNQIKGSLSIFRDFIASTSSCSSISSTVRSTGHLGKGVFSQFRKYNF